MPDPLNKHGMFNTPKDLDAIESWIGVTSARRTHPSLHCGVHGLEPCRRNFNQPEGGHRCLIHLRKLNPLTSHTPSIRTTKGVGSGVSSLLVRCQKTRDRPSLSGTSLPSRHTHTGSWEYGDTYKSEILQNGILTQSTSEWSKHYG